MNFTPVSPCARGGTDVGLQGSWSSQSSVAIITTGRKDDDDEDRFIFIATSSQSHLYNGLGQLAATPGLGAAVDAMA